jgi:predicted amidohydrolase YtcJ
LQVAAEFAALGATAVTNPLHLLDDRAAMLQRLGPTRSSAGRAFAFRTLHQVHEGLA